MATINKLLSGMWCVQIRSHNKYISKFFLKKAHASNWGKEIEYQLDRDQYEDFSDSRTSHNKNTKANPSL